MHCHQAHIGEYRGTTEEHILNKIQLWDANSLLLKEYTYFLSSSLKEGMLRHIYRPTTVDVIYYLARERWI